MSDLPTHKKGTATSIRVSELTKMPLITYILPFSRPLLFLIFIRDTMPQISAAKARMGRKGKKKQGNTKGKKKFKSPIMHKNVRTFEAVTHLDVTGGWLTVVPVFTFISAMFYP